MIQGLNDPPKNGPKRPTYQGFNDPPQNLAETTQGRNDPDSEYTD